MEVIDEGLAPGGNQNNDLNELIADGYDFDFGKYISDGFDVFKKEAGSFIGFGILSGLIIAIAGMIPFGGLIVAPPLTIGFSIYSHKVAYDQSRQFSDFFKGFNGRLFGQLILVSVVSGILSALGMILFILPGIYLAVGYIFASQIVLFYDPKTEFWEAMEFSRKLVTKNWWSFFGLGIVAGLIALSGILLLGIGVLITAPIASCILYAAFNDIVKPSPDSLDYLS
jgi:uncharacterized membrane protein